MGVRSRACWLASSFLAGVLAAGAANAQVQGFDIPPEPAAKSIADFARQSGLQIIAPTGRLRGVMTPALNGKLDTRQALRRLLANTGLQIASDDGSVIVLRMGARAADAAAPPADAAPPAAPPPVRAIGLGDPVVVTASRITAAGFSAPTPTTVIGADAIAKAAEPNLFNAITQWPSLQGSTGTTVNNFNTSTGATGLSALNLRGLGAVRTLTLLDGQRVVPANVSGVTDVSEFPQLLVKRVDVVTGGASASWGSDAVSGVVNVVTDKRFEGVKVNLLAGDSVYNDDLQGLAQIAVGQRFLNDRLHVEASGEYYHNDGVGAGAMGGAQKDGRPRAYLSGSTSYALAATPAGQSQYYYFPRNAQVATYGRDGLITSGPLAGTAFGDNGQVYPFAYGAPCISSTCLGGQQDNAAGGGTSIDGGMNRALVYARVGFDLLPAVEAYATVNVADVRTVEQPNTGALKPGLTLQCSNPFVPASIAAACAADGITSFGFGTNNADFPQSISVANDRQQRRVVLGADGTVEVWGKTISFDAYAEHGENVTNITIQNMTLSPRYSAAIAATTNASGQIVCASSAAQASGCVPWNVFGNVANAAAAWTYLAPAHGPHQFTFEGENAVSASFNLTPARDGAGEVSLAFGGEYRDEYYTVYGDPYGNGSTTNNSAAYPSDPLLSPSGNNWYAGNFHNGTGRYSVGEAFVEVGLPLFDTDPLGQANLDLAVRATDYSTSGFVDTWKIGGTWDTPLEGVRLRAVRSRDIRAPNLSELFAAPTEVNNTAIDRATGQIVQILQNTIGNTALKPEISDNTDGGVVYRPRYLPGFSLSVDYYDIDVQQAISALTAQQIVDLCFNGGTAFCKDVNLTGASGGANPSSVTVQGFNLASLRTDGVDVEASYSFSLRRWNVPGVFLFRGLATRTLSYISNPGIPGQVIQQYAGDNAADTPYWKAYLPASWIIGPATVTVTERIVSDGLINPNAITCQEGRCPASSVQNPTTNFNTIPGAVYLDLGGSWDLNKAAQVYVKIDNVANDRAPPFASPTLYDVIGTMFRVGFRYTH